MRSVKCFAYSATWSRPTSRPTRSWPRSNSQRQDAEKSRSTDAERFARLTPRQVEIFDLVAEGFTNQAIATKLDIGVRTVESYRADVMEKMHAESIAGLVRQAIRLGRMPP